MKRMFETRNAMSARFVISVVTLALATACSAESVAPALRDDGPASSDVGGVALALRLAPGLTLDSAAYTVSGPNSFSRVGSVALSNSATISAVISAIPAGGGYSIRVTGTASDGATTCAGSSSVFAVAAHVTTAVVLHVTCHEAARTGSVAVNGSINVCPRVDGVSANPAEVMVGSTVALSAAAHDTDGGPSVLTFQWTASSGLLSTPTAADAIFTCTAPGPATVSVTVADGDPTSGCADAASLQILCSIPRAGSPAVVSTAAVYGDAPYGVSPTDTTQFLATPAFIASINADPNVSLVLQVGDIHSGKQFCTEAYDRSIYDLWTSFADPLVYTPGDNEWSDCHKVAQGGGSYNVATQQVDLLRDASGNLIDYAGGDPIANLALVRSIFFPRPGSTLGTQKSQVFSQAQWVDPLHPTDANFVENVMWEQSNVLFVAVNVPGGSNNDADVWYGAPLPTAAQTSEIDQRTGADLRWLNAAFAQAQADGVSAVAILAQADMWDPEKGAAHQAGYEPFVQSIAAHATGFGKPVIMFNGDSHVYLSHNPLSASDPLAFMHPGYDVPNFHRIVVHGSTLPLEWLRLTIDPRANAPESPNAFGPFSWERVIQ